MTKEKKPFVEVVELRRGKFVLISVVNKEQLKAIYEVFEPLSRSWRGQFQALAKAIVKAYSNWKTKHL